MLSLFCFLNEDEFFDIIFRKLEHPVIFSQLITPGMTPKSSDIEFVNHKISERQWTPSSSNPNYVPKTRLAEVFKTNPVISLFDCQASHEHADDLWACHANPLHRGHIITKRHTRGLSRLHPAKSFDLNKTDIIFTVNTSKEV